MRLLQWMTVVGLVALFACTEVPRPGRCDRTSDCAGMSTYAGYVCNLDPTPQGNGRCVPACQNSGECEGGRICDLDGQGGGRCLFPVTPDGGGADADGGNADGDAGGGDEPHCPVCSGTTPVCVGVMCVECASSTDCASDPTKPICDTTLHSCVACSADDQCVAKLGPNPGVCMAHQNGHCATDAETIYVEPNPSPACNNVLLSDSDGTAALPLCNIDLARRILASDSAQAQPRTLVRLRGSLSAASGPFTRTPGRPEVSIIGQQGAVVAGGAQDGLDLQSGLFYIRDLKVSASLLVGIKATPGASDSLTLRLERVTVDSCQKGGILLAGAAFDIGNTIITNNGPGQEGTTSWGGVLISVLPVSGPSRLGRVTIQNNKQVGLACVSAIMGNGVLASGNLGGVEIQTSCAVDNCTPAGPTCGANP
jgi:hypothetical protein